MIGCLMEFPVYLRFGAQKYEIPEAACSRTKSSMKLDVPVFTHISYYFNEHVKQIAQLLTSLKIICMSVGLNPNY
jgi:hypothetical protein